MNELPESWTTAPLDELLAAIVGGGTPSKSKASYFQGTIPFMTVKDMHVRFIEDTQDHITQEALDDSASTLIPADTLVVATRMSLGKIARPKVAVAINQDLKALFLNVGIDKTYMEYAWRSQESQIQAMGTGTTVKGIRLDDIRGLELAVAPSAEQIRIADQLDELLTRVQTCNDRFDAIPELLKRFRKSILTNAISGKITTDWRQENGDYEWPITTLESICASDRVITYGVVKLGDEMPNGTPCLRTSNVRWLHFELEGIKRISSRISQEYARTILLGEEVLVNVRGTLGGVAVVQAEMKGWNVSREIAVLPVSPSIANSEFVAFWVGSEASQKWLAKMEKGVAYVGINIEDLRMLPIKLPSLLEQTEIVRRVKALFTLADRIEAGYTAARAHAQRLTPLLLAKAFRGELVPQDPNDEPASALLQRIAAQRTQAALLPKTRKPRVARAVRAPKETAGMTKSRQDANVKDQPYLADHLRRLGGANTAEALFKAAELPVADFYKQLAWEVAKGHIKDHKTALEAAHAP